MKAVLFYESADDVASRVPVHFPAHRQRLEEFHARGLLLRAGTFANPQDEGSMAIFTSRAVAEDFVADDPVVINGVVQRWNIRDWDEVLTP